MDGIETGGVRPQVDAKVNPYDNKDAKSQQSQSKDGAPAKGDSVTLDNFAQKLIDRLRDFFKTDKVAGSQFAQTVTEISMRANVKQTFEGSVTVQGADGAKLSAYSKQTSEVNVQIDIRMTQAQQVADAQSTAKDLQNPFSPDATSQRIADFALSFFPMYALQHKDTPYEQQVSDYQKLVGDAVESGFKEARKVLGDLPSDVTDQIQQTHDMVWQKLSSFLDYARANADKAQTAASAGDWKNFVATFFRQQDGAKPDGTVDKTQQTGNTTAGT